MLSPWCPRGVPMLSPWCPLGDPVVSPCCPLGVPMVSPGCPRSTDTGTQSSLLLHACGWNKEVRLKESMYSLRVHWGSQWGSQWGHSGGHSGVTVGVTLHQSLYSNDIAHHPEIRKPLRYEIPLKLWFFFLSFHITFLQKPQFNGITKLNHQRTLDGAKASVPMIITQCLCVRQ